MPTTRRQRYPTDLTYAEWEHRSPLLTDPTTSGGRPGRPHKHPMREIFDDGSYVVRGRCPWRMLPYDFPPWGTVYYWFGRWHLEGLWQRILVNLRRATRQKEGRIPAASAAIVDSQSVRVSEQPGGIKGCGAVKNVPGRKWHLLVDASGLLRAVRVTPANTSDSRGAWEPLTGLVPLRLRRRETRDVVRKRTGWQLEVVPHNIGSSAFEVLPRRWVVERASTGWVATASA